MSKYNDNFDEMMKEFDKDWTEEREPVSLPTLDDSIDLSQYMEDLPEPNFEEDFKMSESTESSDEDEENIDLSKEIDSSELNQESKKMLQSKMNQKYSGADLDEYLEESIEDLDDVEEDYDDSELDEENFEDNTDFEEDLDDEEELDDSYTESDDEDNEEVLDDEEYEEDFSASLLPGLEEEEVEDLEDFEDHFVPQQEDPKKDKSEMDADERAKEFFDNLKDKVLGLFKKGDSKSKPKKDNERKEEKESKKGPKLPKKIKGPKKTLSKKQKMIVQIGLGVAAALSIALALSTLGFKPLNELEKDAGFKDESTEEKAEFKIKNLSAEEKLLFFDLENIGEISVNFSMTIVLKEKTSIPFKNKKITCQSDIMNLENKGKASIPCNVEVKKDKKYKVDISTENF